MVTAIGTPILNMSRRHRSFLTLAYEWHQRAAWAESMATRNAAFTPIAAILHAARLDCLLEAALCTLQLDLVQPSERGMTWWWISRVATCRLELCPSESFEATWATVWLSTAQGVLIVGSESCTRSITAAFTRNPTQSS